MLDVARQFYTVDYVKSCLDWMAMYKLNVFHWHLTDDEGWRVEIKKHPELTERAAWRGPREEVPPYTVLDTTATGDIIRRRRSGKWCAMRRNDISW